MEQRETTADGHDLGDVSLDDPRIRAVMSLPPEAGVGDRHHVVPRFLLERFATAGQLLVRDLVTERSQLRAVSDIAIRNFYTAVVDVEHAEVGSPERIFDGRIEKTFAVVEGEAAGVLAEVTQSRRPLTNDQKDALATLGSMQYVRGVRTRAENEAMAEFIVKLMATRPALSHHAQHKARVRQARDRGRTPSRGNGRHHVRQRGVPGTLTDKQMREWVVRPHQNDFLKSIGECGQRALDILLKRPLTVVHFPNRSLLIGDEPFVLLEPSPVMHKPACSMTDRERARALNRAHATGRGPGDLMHFYPVRPRALLYADQIAFPVAPDKALVWGTLGADEPDHIELDGAEAAYGIELINRRQAEDAYEWLAGTPDNDALMAAVVPERGPVMRVCTGNSAARAALDVFPGRPLRLRSVD